MKASDEEEYGTFYTQRSSNGARYNRYREYSPNRGHHQNSQSGDPPPYLPPSRSYNRTPPYGTSGRNIVEYAPPCCHQFYHPPPPPVPLHPSPSHFNTIPHPPLQYRDVPACATLNRACYSNRRGTNPYSNYYTSESPYGDPRSDIYYTSTLTRHSSRHSNPNRGNYPSDGSEGKIYESPSQTYHLNNSSNNPQSSVSSHSSASSRANYGSIGSSNVGVGVGSGVGSGMGIGVGGVGSGGGNSGPGSASGGGPSSQGSLLRLDEPRHYSTSALQLGPANTSATLQRSNSPQHFIDRSISLIRLDNTNSGGNNSISSASGTMSSVPEASGSGFGSSTLNTGNSQPRLDRFKIKFGPDLASRQQQQQQQQLAAQQGQPQSGSMTATLTKTLVELGSSGDPLSGVGVCVPGAKPKYKPPIIEVPPKPPVEMSDKAVMTSALPEQWSLMSSGSADGRRISIGATSPMGNSPPPAPTLAGGVPDLLPSFVVRQNEYAANPWRNSGGGNNLPSPRRSYLNSGGGLGGNYGGGGNSSQNPGTSRGGSKSNNSNNYHHQNNAYPRKITKWSIVRKYIRGETKTFFGLEGGEDLKDEWLSRRKRFASRRYSERNVDSMPPPSPYQPTPLPGHGVGGGHDQPDGRIPSMDLRSASMSTTRTRNRRTRKKDHVLVIYWNLVRWLFWSLRFGKTGQRVAAGAGCGSDTNPGSGSTSPGRVPLDSQMSRDRTKSRSVSPNTLAEIPPSVTISPQELFFDDLDDNHRNSTHHLQPPGRGLHWRVANRPYSSSSGYQTSNRISAQLLSKILDNSERQQYRQGLRQPTSTVSKLALIDEYEDFRPYFTYWVTLVHFVILISTMIVYGLAPIGLDLHRKSSLVMVTSLSLQQMEVIQPANLWVGPSAADLIHLGAKYAPCMRRDDAIHRRLVETRDRERQTACCIRNDNSGCVQSSRNECSGLLSTWKKWTGDGGGRISGSVCGLDPKFCEAPASVAPYEWPDDITKWPICRKTRGLNGMSTKDKTAEHMVCEVIGHPCCIGIHAKCLIATKDYCRFVNGYFHEEASLCSQVSCLQDVCGMFPFLSYEQPDQFYRLISSLFLHAGIGHYFFTFLFHIFIMRDLEKLAGPLRIAIIYLGSGMAGNLASVLLEPHRAEVGPGGSQYGLIACLLVELLHMWGMLRKPWHALAKMAVVTGIFFLLGFFPWIDNFAHIIGFLVGFFLSHALMPYVAFGKYSSYRKWLEVILCITLFFAILITLLFVFYAGYGDCEICKLLNCLPLTQDFCAEQDIDFKTSGGGINLVT